MDKTKQSPIPPKPKTISRDPEVVRATVDPKYVRGTIEPPVKK